MSKFFHNSWITRRTLICYRGATAPNPAKFYLCLADTVLLTRSSDVEDFFAAELNTGNGYQRMHISWAEDGAYSNTNKRHDLPAATGSIIAEDESLQFQTAFLIADGDARASENFSTTNVDATSNTITITGNLLTNGRQFLLQADAGSTLPAPLAAETLYTAISSSGGTFQVSSDGTNAIDLSNVGTGSFKLKYANGGIVFLDVFEDPILLQPTRPFEYDVVITGQQANYGVGV